MLNSSSKLSTKRKNMIKKTGYKVTITPKQTCLPSKDKYNKSFTDKQSVEANNYFHTLADRYQCFSRTKPDEVSQQAEGVSYIVVIRTMIE